MGNKGFLIFLLSILAFLLLAAFVVLTFFAPDNENKSNGNPSVEGNSEGVSCEVNDDCENDDPCVLSYCGRGNVCVDVDVVLCYQNDGCCPKGCTPQNDNDCV
jgi:hypothetical protein